MQGYTHELSFLFRSLQIQHRQRFKDFHCRLFELYNCMVSYISLSFLYSYIPGHVYVRFLQDFSCPIAPRIALRYGSRDHVAGPARRRQAHTGYAPPAPPRRTPRAPHTDLEPRHAQEPLLAGSHRGWLGRRGWQDENHEKIDEFVISFRIFLVRLARPSPTVITTTGSRSCALIRPAALHPPCP